MKFYAFTLVHWLASDQESQRTNAFTCRPHTYVTRPTQWASNLPPNYHLLSDFRFPVGRHVVDTSHYGGVHHDS